MTVHHSRKEVPGSGNPSKTDEWLKVVLLLLATFVVYLPAMRGGFVWDDDILLTGNELIPASNGLSRIWFSTENWDYFPITYSSFWLEWRLWGMNPIGYHVFNIVLHAVNALLIWRVLLRLKVPGPWLASLVFAVHPVNAASVAWIAERKNTLSMVFYLASVLCYLGYEMNPKKSLYWLALGMFLLALLSKTSVVMLPVAVLLCCWWQRQKITRQDCLRMVPFFILSLSMGLLTIWFQNHRVIRETVIPMGGFFPRIAGAGFAVCFYIFKALVPFDLSMLYPNWQVHTTQIIWYLPGVLLLATFFTAFYFRKTGGRAVLFGLGYFAISLFPVLGFFKMYYMNFSPVADQWQYLPIIGVITLATAALITLARRVNHERTGKIAAALVVFFLGTLTWKRSLLFKDGETFWSDVLRKDTCSLTANINLALIFLAQGKQNEALTHARRSVEIKAGSIEANLDLAVILQRMGRLEESISHYRKALELRPGNPGAHFNLGVALEASNRPDDAAFEFQAALKLQPEYENARLHLAMLRYRQNRLQEAAVEFQTLIGLNSRSIEAHNGLGSALYKQGNIDQAIIEYEEALRLSPGNENIKQNLDAMIEIKRGSTPH